MTNSFITNSFIRKKILPDFIKQHNLFIYPHKVSKIFPYVGLENCSEKFNPKIIIGPNDLLYIIKYAITSFNKELKSKFNLNKLENADLCIIAENKRLLGIIFYKLECGRYTIIDNKICFADNITNIDGSSICIKMGSDIFVSTKNIFANLEKYISIDLPDETTIANELKGAKINFSASGLTGAWDIVTMSQRGVSSCMRWLAKESAALIGSLLDPCCGIIYIDVPEQTKYGRKMLFRAVVRFAYNDVTSTPYILVDKTYSNFYKNATSSDMDKKIRNAFIAFLQDKTKINIADSTSINNIGSLYIPRAKIMSSLHDNEYSYLDHPIDYSLQDFKDADDMVKRLLPKYKKPTKKKSK